MTRTGAQSATLLQQHSDDDENDNNPGLDADLSDAIVPACSSEDLQPGTTATTVTSSLSHKSIGILGSIAIAVNSTAGPAILQLPFQYQQSGIIPTTLCLVMVAVLSSFCCLHMADTISKVPSNRSFDKCIEFSDVFSIFWNNKAYMVTQILFFLCATCLNVAAIVDTSQVVDSILGFHYKTMGWNMQANQWQSWSQAPCGANNGAAADTSQGVPSCNEPFDEQDVYGQFVLTAGYILTAAVFMPICLLDLKENTAWQIVGFVLLCVLSAYFCFIFIQYESITLDHENSNDDNTTGIPLWGHTWADMVGVILFNFALVMAIPSWLHEKKDIVSVKTVVYGSTAIATTVYISVGILGALAIPQVKVNMLQPMVSGAYGNGLQWSGSLFAFFIGLDIPLFSVLCRYNLTHSGLCNERVANILVVYIPWLTSWLFYQGDAIGELLQWGGVLLTSTLAFVLPLYIALRALVMSTDQKEGSIHVYGVGTSRQAQMIWLYVLLFVATFAVALAIGGQVVSSVNHHHHHGHSRRAT
jgi:amino acid permease